MCIRDRKKAVQNPHLPDIKRKPASPAACAGTWYPDTARMTVNRQYDNLSLIHI